MKKLGAALIFLLGLVLAAPAHAENIVGPPNAIFCNKSAPTAVLSAGTTQVIAGVAGQVINVCGYVESGAGTGTLQLVFGTGGTCTSPTNLTVIVTTTAGQNLQDHFGNAWASSAPGQSLCVVTTGAGSVASVAVYYSQF